MQREKQNNHSICELNKLLPTHRSFRISVDSIDFDCFIEVMNEIRLESLECGWKEATLVRTRSSGEGEQVFFEIG